MFGTCPKCESNSWEFEIDLNYNMMTLKCKECSYEIHFALLHPMMDILWNAVQSALDTDILQKLKTGGNNE